MALPVAYCSKQLQLCLEAALTFLPLCALFCEWEACGMALDHWTPVCFSRLTYAPPSPHFVIPQASRSALWPLEQKGKSFPASGHMHRLLLLPRMLFSPIFTLLSPPYPSSLNLSISKIFIKTFHDPCPPITLTAKRNILVRCYHHSILFLHNMYQICNYIYVDLIKVWFPPQTSRSMRAGTKIVLLTIAPISWHMESIQTVNAK